jgi:hypothetical protein
MKKVLILVVFLSAIQAMFAQTSSPDLKKVNNKNMAIDFSVGYSFSIGNYASVDQNKQNAGYASNGFLAQFGIDWMGKKNLGLCIQYSYQNSPLKDAAWNSIPGGSSGSWSNHCFMLGAVFMKTIRKIHLDCKVLGGAVVSINPTFQTLDPTDTSGLRYNQNTGAGFAYQVSAGAGYTISPHVAFKFNLCLLGGWPVARKQYHPQLLYYEKHINPVSGLPYWEPVYSAPVDYEIKKVISTLSPSIGLVYRF